MKLHFGLRAQLWRCHSRGLRSPTTGRASLLEGKPLLPFIAFGPLDVAQRPRARVRRLVVRAVAASASALTSQRRRGLCRMAASCQVPASRTCGCILTLYLACCLYTGRVAVNLVAVAQVGGSAPITPFIAFGPLCILKELQEQALCSVDAQSLQLGLDNVLFALRRS